MENSSLLGLISLGGEVIPTDVVEKISRDSGNDIDFKCCHCATPFQYEYGKYDKKSGDTKYRENK